MKGHIDHSGAAVSLAAENVDAELRVILRRLQLEEAADWRREGSNP